MTSSDLKSCATASNATLVEQIIEQGQRLRNSIVQAILNYDPYNDEIISNKNLTYPKFKSPSEVNLAEFCAKEPSTSSFISERFESKTKKNQVCDADKLFSFLQGEIMSQDDERIALESLRTISPSEFAKRSKEAHKKFNRLNCNCEMCSKRETFSVKCEGLKVPILNLNLSPNCDTKPCLASLEHLKFVNSLKVIVYCLKLNTTGHRKMFHSVDKRGILSVHKTFFIEYAIPDSISKSGKMRSKINSGLLDNKSVRFCSKMFADQEAIYFKQISIHDTCNVSESTLHDLILKFRISCRTMSEKRALTFGEASLNIYSVMHSPFFIANQELAVTDVNSGIALGTLKVSVMLGCDKIHFGSEFIDAINASKGNASLSSDDSILQAVEQPVKAVKVPVVPAKPAVIQKPKAVLLKKPVTIAKTKCDNKQVSINRDRFVCEESLLYGLIYVSEANYLRNSCVNSYVVCHSFHNNDTVQSRVFSSNSNPVFNFYQLEPILYNEEFLDHMRENFIVIEFWEKCYSSPDQLIGISKLSLHQFYITYRNPAIVKHLLKNKYPVISVDWWEPITNPFNSSEICGQTQTLLAVGTEAQIQVLELSRGLKQPPLQKPPPNPKIVPLPKTHPVIINPPAPSVSSAVTTKAKRVFLKKKPLKADASVQSEMEPPPPPPDKNGESKHVSEQRDLLMALIKQLTVPNPVPAPAQAVLSKENGTNTDVKNTDVGQTQTDPNTDRRDTFTIPAVPAPRTNSLSRSSLLATFQKALLTDNGAGSNGNDPFPTRTPASFKCHVVVEEAMHLPMRKKAKAKRNNKGKNVKSDDGVFPSAYVTFETVPGAEMKVTKVMARTGNPKWDYRTDVMLPVDLLFNNQKRLIFKVWRKSQGPHLVPNLHTDLVVGFAALDLTVLMAGLPTIQGWFNIVDFTNKCNGQIKICITPLENLQKLSKPSPNLSNANAPTPDSSSPQLIPPAEIPNEDMDLENSCESSELLSRALKRKFTELDEITQRLRLRLSKVTDDDSDVSNDDFSDAFERDINTLCVEDDFDTNNFEEEFVPLQQIPAGDALLQREQPQPGCSYQPQETAGNPLQIVLPADERTGENVPALLTLDSLKGSSGFSAHLTQNKLRIDTLLEKLSLITAGNGERSVVEGSFSNRYVSGRSAEEPASDNGNGFVEGIMKELGIDSLEEDAANAELLQQFYNSASSISSPDLNAVRDLLSNSGSSLLSNGDVSRSEPDGEGSGKDGVS